MNPSAVFHDVENGSFKIGTFESGLLALRFVGTYHEKLDVPVYADTPVRAELDVQLGTASYASGFERLMVLAADVPNMMAMERQPDGQFTLDIETEDSVVNYLILEAWAGAGMRTLHGTDSDEFDYGVGGYGSVVRPIEGIVSIVFDPSRLSQVERESETTFREPDSFIARLAGRLQRVNDRYDVYREAWRNSDGGDFTYDWAEDIAALEAELAAEQDSVVRQTLLLDLIRIQSNNGEVEPALLSKVCRRLALSHTSGH